MVDAVAVKGVRERPHHVLLADQFGKAAGSPLAGEGLIGHRGVRGGERDCATAAGRDKGAISFRVAALYAPRRI